MVLVDSTVMLGLLYPSGEYEGSGPSGRDQLRDMKLGETDAVIRCSTEHGRALQNKLLPGGEGTWVETLAHAPTRPAHGEGHADQRRSS